MSALNPATSSSNVLNILSLPEEILTHIFEYPDSPSLVSAGMVCKVFRRIIPSQETRDFCLEAIGHKHLSLAQWARANGCGWHEDEPGTEVWIAAKNGDLDALRWLKECDAPVEDDAYQAAADGGHLEALKFLYEWLKPKGVELDEYVFDGAAKRGHLNMLRWLHDQGCPFSARTFNKACESGNLNAIGYLGTIGCFGDFMAYGYAAKRGHLHVLACLEAMECPKGRESPKVFEVAAKGGKLPALKWLKERAYAWNQQACVKAAQHGHLEAVRWLQENGCPLSAETAVAAVTFGQLEVLKFLKEKNCPWLPSELTEEAVVCDEKEILAWLLQQGCPFEGEAWIKRAIKSKSLNILEFLIKERGCTLYPDALVDAVAEDCLDLLKCLKKMNFPWDKRACTKAAQEGNLEALKWLVKKGCPFDKNECIEAAPLEEKERVIKCLSSYETFVKDPSPTLQELKSSRLDSNRILS